MTTLPRATLALAALLGCCPAGALPLNGELAYTVDDTGGYAVDADLQVDLSRRVAFSAGAGRTVGSDETGGLHGTSAEAGFAFSGERAGVSLRYDLFDDSSSYQAGTLGARAWVTAGDFRFALLGRRRDLAVQITLELPLRTLHREVEFSATGAGVEISYSHEDLSAYVLALAYDYDEEFDDFMDLVESPQLADRPRLEALVASMLTQTQGVIDRQYAVGAGYAFGRHSLALDLSTVHDTVRDTRGNSVALSYRQARSAHLDWGLTAGLADSDAFGGIAFLGFNLGLAN